MTTDAEAESELSQGRDAPIDPATWVEEHGDALYRFALARTGRHDLAEDLVQETFVAALAGLSSFRGRSAARTWLIAILRRRVADHFRGAGRPGTDAAPGPCFDRSGAWVEPPGRWRSPERLVEDEEFRETLAACVDRLPGHLADPFVLREREGVGTDELRAMFGLKPENLRVRLHRARLLLRECLEKSWFRDQG